MRSATIIVSMLAGCAGRLPAAAEWDAAAAAQARAQVEATFRALEAKDLPGFEAALAREGTVASYDLDMEGKPLRLSTRDQGVQYVSAIFAEMNKMGARLSMDVRAIDCRAVATVAWCAAEYEFAATLPDGKRMAQPSRSTFVLVKRDGAWSWAHWHTSLSQAAAPGGH